jgi:nitrate reductase beta subunit
MHSCVGCIRYLGVLLYDADRIEQVASLPDKELEEAQRDLILDPDDPAVIRQARENGVHDKIMEAAQKSPVYRYVKEWKLALPLHPEFRTLPMLFYVPPLLPVMASMRNGRYTLHDDFFSSLESARVPIRYLASLLAAGQEGAIIRVYRRLMALRIYKRAETVGDVPKAEAEKFVAEAQTTPEELEAIYHMTSLATFEERFAIPPFLREMAIETVVDPETRKSEVGAGFTHPPKRGW